MWWGGGAVCWDTHGEREMVQQYCLLSQAVVCCLARLVYAHSSAAEVDTCSESTRSMENHSCRGQGAREKGAGEEQNCEGGDASTVGELQQVKLKSFKSVWYVTRSWAAHPGQFKVRPVLACVSVCVVNDNP